MTHLPTPAREHRWPMSIDCGALRLRPLRRRDAREWDEVRRRNWDWLRPWEPTAPPESAGDVLSFPGMVKALQRQARQVRSLPFVVEHRAPGQPPRLIGQVTMSGIALGSARFGQVGYWIDQAYAGRGVTPFCVAVVCDHAFAVMALHRVEIVIRPENAASLRVVEKLGFREEGPRPAYLHIDGDWRDHRVFALHAEELAAPLATRVPLPRM